jgi:hypothetical protein
MILHGLNRRSAHVVGIRLDTSRVPAVRRSERSIFETAFRARRTLGPCQTCSRISICMEAITLVSSVAWRFGSCTMVRHLMNSASTRTFFASLHRDSSDTFSTNPKGEHPFCAVRSGLDEVALGRGGSREHVRLGRDGEVCVPRFYAVTAGRPSFYRS